MSEASTQTAALLERLGSKDRRTQRNACEEAIQQLDRAAALYPLLVRLLHEGTLHARFAAAFVLFRARGPTLRILGALLDALEFEDGDLRWSATEMLVALGRTQSEVLPVLLQEARKSSSARRRRMTLYALRELAPERQETLTAFVDALDDPDAEIRRAALSCLAKAQETDRSCVDRVVGILGDDPDPRMRRIAAVVLPDLADRHPDARERARESLLAAVESPDMALTRAARSALARMRGLDRAQG